MKKSKRRRYQSFHIIFAGYDDYTIDVEGPINQQVMKEKVLDAIRKALVKRRDVKDLTFCH